MNQHATFCFSRLFLTLLMAALAGLYALPAAAQLDLATLPGAAKGAPATAASPPYTPTSLPCSINAACPAGTGWEAAIAATVRIVQGSGSCTGVLINNTRQDQKPYILTARHCGNPKVGDTVDWVFEFNYQSDTCGDPAQAPVAQTLTGAVVRAAKSKRADYALLELLDPIPASFNVYFAGWSRSEAAPTLGVAVGHPRGDIKKITLDHDTLGDAGDSWQANFDEGTIEGGSSGSPLFNQNGQFVGHLRSAISMDNNACSGPGGDDNQARVLFPKLAYIWGLGKAGKRVSDFLDPDGLGLMSLPALQATTPPPSSITLRLNKVFRKSNGTKKAKLSWGPAEVSTDRVDVYVDDTKVKTTANDGIHKQTINAPGDGPFALYICEQNSATACSNTVMADFTNALTVYDDKDEDDEASFGKGGGLDTAEAPGRFALHGNYPNPFNPATTIQFDLPARAEVQVQVFDVMGRQQMAIPAQTLEAGTRHRITLDASALASGTYLYRILAITASETLVETGRMTLVR